MLSCKPEKEKPVQIPVAEIKAQLKEIWNTDQLYRRQAADLRKHNNNIRTPEEAVLWQEQQKLDSVNMDKLEKIIAKYGYPGKNIVGDSLKQIAAFVIMHNPKRQAPYVGMMWKVAQEGNITLFDAASLEDRVLMFSGKKQKYGTQMKYDTISINKETGAIKTKLRIWPIEQPKKVDSLRFRIGLYPVQRQCDLMGIDVNTVEGYSFFPKGLKRPGVH